MTEGTFRVRADGADGPDGPAGGHGIRITCENYGMPLNGSLNEAVEALP